MQYHLNGFRPGNPDVKAPAPGRDTHADLVPDTVAVLIAGCGPAAPCPAAQLALCPDLTTPLVEPKSGPLEKGQADGVSVRSMEMFQAFGVAETVKREAYWVNQSAFWRPDPATPGETAAASVPHRHGVCAAGATGARVHARPDGSARLRRHPTEYVQTTVQTSRERMRT